MEQRSDSVAPAQLSLENARLLEKNRKLAGALQEARDQIAELRDSVGELAVVPNTFAVADRLVDESTLDVIQSGRKLRLTVAPEVSIESIEPGQEVLVSESMVVIGVGEYERKGELGTVKELLGDDRAIVVSRADDERMVMLSGPLRDRAQQPLRVGDALLFDSRSGYAFERIIRAEVEDLVLEEVPDVDYSDIGGLSAQIGQIKDAVELPFLHPDLYREHGLKSPKGVLLYGPPGCGKTLIAKAVARSLARAVASEDTAGFFLNIKGPELLNKYVGETERHIRLIFARAREKATGGAPVIVFFDEMDSLFRTRGTGVSSDVETTVVPQLLSEIDGVEKLENVIVIGASNREDMIDPAILRPGRLDVKIKIERPDKEAAREIFGKYLTANLPLHASELAARDGDREATVAAMIDVVVECMYTESEENRFLEVTYASGDQEVLYFKDFNSGAIIHNIVDRAKKAAIKELLQSGSPGIKVAHLLDGYRAEFKESEDLPNTTNPDDWARVSGKKGERIVFIRSVAQRHDLNREAPSARTVTSTGQYL